MKRRTKLLCTVLAAALLALSACSSKPSDTTRVVLDWTPNTNHTGLYVALELGYYEDAGLTVEIVQPPDDGALALVGAGDAEFCIGFQESFGPAIAANNPVPVTAVAAIINHNTSGVLSLAATGIESPADLMGKRFATWGTPLVDETIRAVVEGDGGVFEEVVMVPDAATDAISALQTSIDAIWIYYGWDAVAAELAGVDFNYFHFVDHEPVFDMYSPMLVVGDGFLENEPEKVRAFLAATARGYQYAVDNPDEAAAILLKHAPELDEALVVASQRWLAGQYIADGPYWGYIDQGRWAGFYDWMYEKNLLDRALGAEGFTNEYLPG